MTVPVAPPPAPPSSPAPTDETEPWQQRLEVLALLLVLSVVAVLVSGLVSANAQLGSVASDPSGVEPPAVGIDEVVRVGGASANLIVAGALLVALLLVTLGPGDRIGRRGSTVLRGLVGVGLVSAGLAGISSVLTVMYDPDELSGARLSTDFVAEGLVGRLSGVAPLVVAAVIAGYVAWCAFSTLGEVPPEVVAPDDPDRDLGTEPEGAWAPAPAPLQ
ncbi:MAG: hypothetical protein JWO77_661 [Ilumatobacteraceae bacterium]|nr:hypothetical protein [Ilumatobacteraceae bacterium]